MKIGLCVPILPITELGGLDGARDVSGVYGVIPHTQRDVERSVPGLPLILLLNSWTWAGLTLWDQQSKQMTDVSLNQ